MLQRVQKLVKIILGVFLSCFLDIGQIRKKDLTIQMADRPSRHLSATCRGLASGSQTRVSTSIACAGIFMPGT